MLAIAKKYPKSNVDNLIPVYMNDRDPYSEAKDAR